MARGNSYFLDNGDAFPEIEMPVITGESIITPQGLGDGYSAILFYRGYW